jgi:hypothetical protein
MSKNLTSGAGDLIGGVTNLSKDVINKLQRKNLPDEKKEEGDWWLESIIDLKIKKKMAPFMEALRRNKVEIKPR